MVFRDWTLAADYAFCADLGAAGWAWEFLRRNPRYQAEWAAFDAVWQALEAAYGRPPDRDFCAWKADPRAWVHAADCPGGECRVDQDKVLIECALGARWGFYKFPPDPADNDPVGGERLAWREWETHTPVLERGDADWLDGGPGHVALGFDLSLPLPGQLERAKRILQVLQRRGRQSGDIEPPCLRARWRSLALMLRLLDARAAGADDAALATIDAGWQGLLEGAARLRDGDYRRLLVLQP
jgi:hypothetical protein